MILLDTDHVSVLSHPTSERYHRLSTRLSAATGEIVAVGIVTIEEQMRGWLASIAKERHLSRQVKSYRELADLFEFFTHFHIAAFSDEAASRCEQLRAIHIGAMDKKIAAIALATNSLLLTANRQHFERVPRLRFENWMD